MVGAVHVPELMGEQCWIQTSRSHVQVFKCAWLVPSGAVSILLVDDQHEVPIGRKVNLLALFDHWYHSTACIEPQHVPAGA